MPVLVEAVETAFEVRGIRDDRVLLQGYGPQGEPGQVYELPVGDTFHIAYDAEFGVLDFLLAWATGQRLRSPARKACNCMWDRKSSL